VATGAPGRMKREMGDSATSVASPLMHLRSLAWLLPLPLCTGLAAESPAHVAEFAGAEGDRVRAEAPDAGIVRLWFKPAGPFTREASLAMEAAPTTRVPLVVTETATRTTVATGALTVSFDRRTLAFEIRSQSTGEAIMPATTIGAAKDGPAWTLTRALGAGERLLGLGQDNRNGGRLDRRGTVRELWAGQQINSGNVTAEYPVPLLLSLGADGTAYGVFFDNVHRLRFDLGAAQPDTLRLDADGGEIDLYVIAGPKLTDVLERYTRLTGRPPLPPLWALGYWQSKCSYYDWRALDEAYGQLHARGFPVDAMVIDYDWPEVANNFRWAARWSAPGVAPADRVSDYARRGVRIVMSQTGPMMREESPTFAAGWAAGIFATDGKGHPIECGYYGGKLIDFTSPKLEHWLWPQVAPRIAEGVAGWWLDLTEPEGEPPQAVYHGGRPAEIHNQFSQLCTRSFEGVQLRERPDQRPFILTRCGSAGSQRYHAAFWTGDIYSDYATLRAHPPEMLSSALSGLAWWTNDTGGFMEGYYKNDQMGAHARLYERWMQFSAFCPITRAHKAGGLPEPYQFGPAVEQSTRHYLQQRYRLLPYIYSHAWEASRTGVPLVRALALEFQDDAASVAAPGDEYLFGRDLLVAPVLHEGVTNRRVYFPPGRWFDWDTGVEYAGGCEWVVAAPQNRIPVAVRAGAIIPLAPDMLSTGEKPWDPLTLEIFPAARSEFTLYRDDGTTFGYRRGEFTTTRILCTAAAGSVRVEIGESNKRFTPATYLVRLHLEHTPQAATLGGAPTPFSWDAEARVLTCAVDARGGTTHVLAVALDARLLPARPAPELVADAVNLSGEAAGSGGRPVPHFFPAPALPARVKASNYDKGGEGVAFHTTRPLPAKPLYRPDDFGLVETQDAGGGLALAGLRTGEWVRYSLDCGAGGYHDLTMRVASASGGGRVRLVALDQTIATVEVPATGGDDVFQDVRVANVYFNPGELSLLLFVEAPGFTLNTFSLAPAVQPPAVYPAIRAARAGVAELERDGGGAGRGAVRNFGRNGCSLTFGVNAPATDEATLLLRYQNTRGKPLPYSVQIGAAATTKFILPDTAGEWRDFPLKVTLQAGANTVVVRGLVEGWDGVTVEHLALSGH